MKIVVVAGLIAIVTALFSALVFLRVGLSISLIAFLLFSYWMGWIAPHGMR